MALSRQALSGYDAALSKVEAAAAEYVRRRVEAYLESFPQASVADVREFAKEAVGQAVDAYGDAASTAAADLYDELAEAAGESLPAAAVDTSDVSGYIDRGVRYQAGKLVDGAPTAFAARVSDLARDQVARRANQTMRRNAARDKIRYARVPMGGETCTFCAMLASRGFAYRSASAAGEGNHYHPNCRCKVVPETAGSVEGYDPDERLGRWQAMRDIDADPRLTAAQKLEAKGRISFDAIRQSGAISGALNDSNDPDGQRRMDHAELYFEEVRSRNPDHEIKGVANGSGIDEDTVRRAYMHLFIDEHDLVGGRRRFDADYYEAESWQRLRSGVGVQPHDIVLIQHEALESRYMADGLSYLEAHRKAESKYNYQEALNRWREEREP